jgi:capsular exopolysaccharide synthesis family protein
MMKGYSIGDSGGTLVSNVSNTFPAPGQLPGAFRIEPEVRYRLLLRRHSRAIVAICFVCLLASGLISCFMTPSYKAKAVVEVLPVNGDFLNTKDINPNMASSTMDTYLDTQTRLLKSDSVADRVVASLLATEGAAYGRNSASVFSRLRKHIGLQSPSKNALESEIRAMLSNLQVKPEGQSSLISISVTGSSSQLAADTANAVANQHIAALQDARGEMATQTTEFLTGQLNSLRAKLKQSEDELQAYARRSGLVFTSELDHESVGAEKLKEVQADLEKAEADRADKQSQMELINSGPADSLPKVLDDGTIKEAESKLADLKRQLATLNDLYTPNHYKVREAKAEIDAVEGQIKAQRALVVSRIKNDYRAAVRREALQKDNYNHQVSIVSDQSAKQVGYNILKREVDANRDLYQSMLQRIREATVVAALRASNIRIVDRAKRPAFPTQPNVPVNTALGLLAGCLLSALYVLLRERSDGSIRAAGHTVRVLQSRELAIIPSARHDIRTQIASNSQDGRAALARFFTKKQSNSSADLSKDLFSSWRTTQSIVAESFRSAVASILVWGREQSEAPHKVLVVTSAHSAAGKTTSVLNLGLGLVESGRRVLLIDADLRIPRLGNIFGLKSSVGLTDILDKKLIPGIAVELIHYTGMDRLHILPSGTRYANVTELLHSNTLKELLEYLRLQYDFIIIDTPPTLALTDSRLLAQNADGVILVVRAGVTTIEQTATVQECFRQDGTEIFGSILNDWDARTEDPTYVNSYFKYATPREKGLSPGLISRSHATGSRSLPKKSLRLLASLGFSASEGRKAE